jgi:hypothetical protein
MIIYVLTTHILNVMDKRMTTIRLVLVLCHQLLNMKPYVRNTNSETALLS